MRFTQSHEWIEVKDQIGTVGISLFAQKELGEIVYIQLPKVGQTVQAGKEIAVLESTKAAADVYSPVSGTVIAINDLVAKDPGLINRSPESAAWLFRLKLSSPAEFDQLMPEDAYLKTLSS
jgi:glycine cleavage system H protein